MKATRLKSGGRNDERTTTCKLEGCDMYLFLSNVFLFANLFIAVVINAASVTETEKNDLLCLQLFFLFIQVIFLAVHWHKEWR